MALKNKKKIDFLSIGIRLAIVGASIFLISELLKMYKKWKANKKTEDTPIVGSSSSGGGSVVVQGLDLDKVLKFGINAKPEVKVLQQWVNADGGTSADNKKLVVDGLFGQKTKEALFGLKGVNEASLNQYRKIPIRNQYDGSGILPKSGGGSSY
jgi:hypothetical protein